MRNSSTSVLIIITIIISMNRSLLVSGMMRKGLFIFIIAGKVACYCKHVSVKITDDDVIRKDGGRREMRWEDGDEMGECTWAVEMET